ncbi:hypothetical protein GOBAR_AA37331 [Gossypium barbadense]|uniref:Uncharacterized protein n=1 Tax=Gossypium barbadense TaxID=3634 RepID=A0A2P5VX19_GOSBA|nr:hypothetical protein GOBAR_AA37331 [Gossypium barbadense]
MAASALGKARFLLFDHIALDFLVELCKHLPPRAGGHMALRAYYNQRGNSRQDKADRARESERGRREGNTLESERGSREWAEQRNGRMHQRKNSKRTQEA